MGKRRTPSNVIKFRARRRSLVAPVLMLSGVIGASAGAAVFMVSPWFLANADTIPHMIMKDFAALRDRPCGYVSVHDGDTFRCDRQRIRLVAASGPMDAPELRDSPRCDQGRNGWCDQALAERARNRLSELLDEDGLAIHCTGNDRYGRSLCTAAIDGRDVGDILVAEGLAVIRNEWR